MQYDDFLRKRLSELRIHKGVSARDMSLTLGQSESYINKIENGKALPSMEVFFYICEYFGIEPKDFFSDQKGNMIELNQLIEQLAALDQDSITSLRIIIEKLAK